MGKFLLNRPDDRDTQSKGRIFANMLIWLIILYAGCQVLYVICMLIYGANGVIPTKLTDLLCGSFLLEGKALLANDSLVFDCCPSLRRIDFPVGIVI